jgi:hypothetical protein
LFVEVRGKPCHATSIDVCAYTLSLISICFKPQTRICSLAHVAPTPQSLARHYRSLGHSKHYSED